MEDEAKNRGSWTVVVIVVAAVVFVPLFYFGAFFLTANASGTGFTGADTRASLRPRTNLTTAWRPWNTSGGTSSFSTPQRNIRLIRPSAC